jgi:hypothetical protein
MIALVCIVISPYYKMSVSRPIKREPIQESTKITETKSPKTIVLLTDSFLPVTFAGSELSAYETIKYLRARGHNIIIFVNIKDYF